MKTILIFLAVFLGLLALRSLTRADEPPIPTWQEIYGHPISLDDYRPAQAPPILPLVNVSTQSPPKTFADHAQAGMAVNSYATLPPAPPVPRVEPPAGWIEVDEKVPCATCPAGFRYTGRTIRVPAPSAPTEGVGQPAMSGAASSCPCVANGGFCPCAASVRADSGALPVRANEASCGSEGPTFSAPVVVRRGLFGRRIIVTN